jgi:hypothetical protein
MSTLPAAGQTRPSRSRGRRIAVLVAVIGVVYAIAMGAFVLWRAPGVIPNQQSVVLFAVGNLGDAGSAQTGALARLLTQHRMDALALLGDLAPPDGSASAWQASYDPVFGAFDRSVRPTPGAVEYGTKDASGYFSYFSKRSGTFTGAPYYAFTLGSWRIYSLNSQIGQGNPGSDMYEWLRRDLTTTTEPCVAAFWYAPVQTAGPGAADAGQMSHIYTLLAAEGADIVLSGHDENYQRWAPVGGITSFVVGTGGAGLAAPTNKDASLAATSSASAGALELDLHPGSADYQYLNTAGTAVDSGSLRCHGRPTAALPRPAAPTGLKAAPSAKGVGLTWTAATGEPAPIGYLVYRGSDPIGFTVAPSFVDTTLPPGASVLYSVRSVAPSGARSTPSDAAHSGGGVPGYTDYTWALQDANPAAPTQDKPQSKLWYNDGSWWGILYGNDPAQPVRSAFFIQRFDASAQAWINTGVEVDDRNRSHADALWDTPTKTLYVASTIRSGGAKLYRYSYANGAYTLDSGFPVRLTNDGSESMTIAKDSTGTLWVTMTQLADGNGACAPAQPCVVRVMHSTDADWNWTQPYQLPLDGVVVDPDDISAVLSYGGKYVGVAWSNQLRGAFLFATHVDGASDKSWKVETIEVAPRGSDDHLNLKTDSAGNVYLIGKTSLNDPANASPKLPLMVLWVRSANDTWRSSTVWTVADDMTRPQVVVDEQAGRVYAIAAHPAYGGSVYVKSASISDLVFPSGLGTVLLASGEMNNPTTTKQTVSLRQGILVLASDTKTHTYWHNIITPALMGGGG